MKKISNLVLILSFYTVVIHAQGTVPNGGFEDWTSMGNYNNPNSWTCLNDMTAYTNTYTCLKGTPGNPGSSYIKLVTRTAGAMGIMPGIAVTGYFDMNTFQPAGGFPFTERPQSLSGNWQFMAFGNDQGFISVILTKWNTFSGMRDTVATLYNPLAGMEMSWVHFSLDFNYESNESPDSAQIILSSSGADGAEWAINSYLYIDNLSFDGTVSGIKAVTENQQLLISPVPANDHLQVSLPALSGKEITLHITDVTGRLYKTQTETFTGTGSTISIADLPKGNYLITVDADGKTFSGNFMKQ